MNRIKRPGPTLIWLALIGLWMWALAPTVSKWRAAAQGVEWVEVCSAQGVKRVPMPANRSGDAPSHTQDTGHCGYCVAQNHAGGWPPVTHHWVAPPLSGGAVRVGSSGVTLVKRLIRSPHPPRAPPVFS